MNATLPFIGLTLILQNNDLCHKIRPTVVVYLFYRGELPGRHEISYLRMKIGQCFKKTQSAKGFLRALCF